MGYILMPGPKRQYTSLKYLFVCFQASIPVFRGKYYKGYKRVKQTLVCPQGASNQCGRMGSWAQNAFLWGTGGIYEVSPYLGICDLSPHEAGTRTIWASFLESFIQKASRRPKKQYHECSNDFITAPCRGQMLFISTGKLLLERHSALDGEMQSSG